MSTYYPLKKVTWGVSYHIKMIRAGNDSIRAGQRFKRMDRILNKLGRLPTRLSQMEDIGGCRAILTNLDQVYAVGERLNQRWRHATVIDYIQNPKESGYRAYHLIERRDGRLIEVQLRTPQQDQWAVAVETWVPPVVPFNLKNEEGPEDVKRFFKKTSEIMALEEIGEVPDDEDRRELADLRATITAQYLVR